MVHVSPELDAYWVKVWCQPGLGLSRGPERAFPELLLKEDLQDTGSGYVWQRPDWRPWRRHRPYYRGPDVRLEGPVCLDLGAEAPQQIWIQARLPDLPGGRQAWIEIHGQTPPRRLARLPVSLEVLPVRLREPRQDRLLWYPGCLDRDRHQHAVSVVEMKCQLRQIREAGFSSLTVAESKPALAQEVIDLARQAGFNRNIVLLEPHPPQSLRFGPLRPVYYLSDEVDGHDGLALAHHQARYCQVRGWGSTMASLLSPDSIEQLAAYPPDVLSLNVSHSTLLLQVLRSFPERWPRPLYYHWPAHLEKPGLHRLLAGVGLWSSGAEGIAPYCYQHLPGFPADPFDDQDPWEPDFRLKGQLQDFRHHLATYPSQNGPITTVQWEGLREGLLDLAYLTTWEHQLQQSEKRFPKEVEASRQAVKRRLPCVDWGAIRPGSPDREPSPSFSAEDLDTLRQWLIQDILSHQERTS